MGSILSVNMSYSYNMLSFAELSTMTDDQKDSNPFFLEIPLLNIAFGIYYPLKFAENKRSILGVDFERLLS